MNVVEHRFLLVQFFSFWFMIDLKICKSYDFIHCIGLKLQFLLLTNSSPKSSCRGGCFGAPIWFWTWEGKGGWMPLEFQVNQGLIVLQSVWDSSLASILSFLVFLLPASSLLFQLEALSYYVSLVGIPGWYGAQLCSPGWPLTLPSPVKGIV